MHPDWINALCGGILIGIAVSLMLLWNGRVAGISGIIGGVLRPNNGDTSWRWLFLLGLVGGGFALRLFQRDVFGTPLAMPDWSTIVAGALVGLGTSMGSGCTSGHGVCGMSRLSIRSIVATFIFILSGIGTVFLIKKLGAL
jgi:uncharacterized membrane protein YedE/YeeE